MNTISLALYTWPLVSILLFACLRQKHWALIWSVILGTLFLPEIQMSPVSPEAPDPNGFKLFVIIKSTKPNTIAFGALLGAILFDGRRLLRFRPCWFDVPMLIWCLVPLLSDLLIPVSLYDALAAVRDQTLMWGVPYLLARVYFSDASSLRDLMVGVVLGGLAYVPLCLLEARYFPFLHQRLYGFFPGDPNEAIRWGGYRPIGFMSHGLMTAVWMVAAALTAIWLWRTGAAPRLPVRLGQRTLGMGWAALLLAFTALATRSTGAIFLGIVCLAALFQLRWIRQPILLCLLLVAAPIQMALRTTVWWEDPAAMMNAPPYDPNQAGVVDQVWAALTSWDNVKDRKASDAFRKINENFLIRRMWDQPCFGYGDTGLGFKIPALKKRPDDSDRAVTDSFWIITLACYGFIGLAAVCAAMLLPSLRFLTRFRRHALASPALAPAAVAATVLILYMLDNLWNGFYNPVYVLLAGGLAGWTPAADLAPGAATGEGAQTEVGPQAESAA